VIVSGRITFPPELKTVGDNKTLCTLGIAVNEWNPRNKSETTNYVDITTWGELAKRCSTLKQGTYVIIQAVIRTRQVEAGGKKFNNANFWANTVTPIVTAAPPKEEETPEVGEDIPW
jgi:single-stranded DNA-binding protein